MRIRSWVALGLVGLGAAACTSGIPPNPAANVAGTWRGTWAYQAAPTGSATSAGTGNVEWNLQQNGPKVTGTMTIPQIPQPITVPVTGTVYGYDFQLDGVNATGWMHVRGDQMSGRVYGVFGQTQWLYGVYPANVALTRAR